MFKTGKYWYSGTPDNATIRVYLGFDDTEVIMPEIIYNTEQKQAYHIKSVKFYDTDMKNFYTLTIREGIEVLDSTLGRVTEVTLPEGLRSFKTSFCVSGYLTELYIPSSVDEIVDVAFNSNIVYDKDWPRLRDSIERIVFAPDSQCKTIGRSAFSGLHALTELVLPSHLEVIGINAFGSTENLTSIVIPETVRVIEAYAFSYSGIESIVLPSGLTEIGEFAFYQCSNLASVTFPASLIEIGTRAFDRCEALTEAVLQNGVVLLGDGAFERCTSLLSVVLSDSIKVIPSDCFSNCDALESVNFPANCVEIGDGAFMNCVSLTDITIPFGVTRIGRLAFYNIGMTSLDIPASVDHLGGDFAGNISANNDNWPEVYFYSHSIMLPIFEPELIYSGVQEQEIKRIYCHGGTGAYFIAQRNNIPRSAYNMPEQYDLYRLIRIFDKDNNQVSSSEVREIRWYDETTGELIFAGKSVELPSSLARLEHTLRCDVTFTSEYRD